MVYFKCVCLLVHFRINLKSEQDTIQIKYSAEKEQVTFKIKQEVKNERKARENTGSIEKIKNSKITKEGEENIYKRIRKRSLYRSLPFSFVKLDELRSCRTLRAFTVTPCEVRGTPTFYSFWIFLHTFCDIYVKKHILRFYTCCIRDIKECKRR